MTAKRRTFRGRRRTLKGGDCCDYEKLNESKCGGLSTDNSKYNEYVLPKEKYYASSIYLSF